MTFTFADTLSTGALCTLFNSAFSDYVLPMVLTEPVMTLKLTRDGTNLYLSPLALEQGKPVGFILNALGTWQGKRTAYNGGTGVVPEARGQALTAQLYAYVLPFLKAQGVEQCLLEVIQQNTRALGVYSRLGFKVTRSLKCFRGVKANLRWHTHTPQRVNFLKVAFPNWPLYQRFWDVAPSWQHQTASIDRSQGHVQIVEAQVDGRCVGYGIVYPLTGAVAQLAVDKAWRGQGIGQALLQEFLPFTTQPAVSMVNVEDGADSLLQFLQNRNMTETLSQYEMVWAV